MRSTPEIQHEVERYTDSILTGVQELRNRSDEVTEEDLSILMGVDMNLWGLLSDMDDYKEHL